MVCLAQQITSQVGNKNPGNIPRIAALQLLLLKPNVQLGGDLNGKNTLLPTNVIVDGGTRVNKENSSKTQTYCMAVTLRFLC